MQRIFLCVQLEFCECIFGLKVCACAKTTIFSQSARRRGVEMGFLLWGGGGGRSKALSLVFFCLLLMPTDRVLARDLANVPSSVSPSALQEPSPTDELVIVLKGIQSSLKWSGITVVMGSLVVLFVMEFLKIKPVVYTQYLVDRQREVQAQEDPLGASANSVPAQQSAEEHKGQRLRRRIRSPAQQPAALNRRATTTADADREENQTNSEVFGLAKGLQSGYPHRRDNPPHWPSVETEASTEKAKEALIEGRGHHCSIWMGD